MRGILSPWTFTIAAVLTVIAILESPNATLWVACLLTLPLAIWLLGDNQACRVLIWLIGISWLQVIGSVVVADVSGNVLSEGWMGPYQEKAIILSLCAISVVALGMRLSGWLFRAPNPISITASAGDGDGINLNRIVLCYFISLIVIQVLGALANLLPEIAQPILALTLIKFVCIYLIAAKIFESQRGYYWLILVSLLELVMGVVEFFAGYKEAFFIMLIALASSRRPASTRMWIFGLTAVLAVVWVSLVWTVSKKEYRYQVFSRPIEQKVEWMARRILVDPIDYGDAATKLIERVAYTDLFANVIARKDTGQIPSTSYYALAVQHILTPRFLFPDKASLNDSMITTALTGIRINENTSIGVGLVALAYADFGLPGFWVPILLVGFAIGVAARYFMTRSAPMFVRQAFATAALFQTFQFAADIDKSLGGFVVGFLAMALTLKFGYPLIARWLAGSRGLGIYANNPSGKIRA